MGKTKKKSYAKQHARVKKSRRKLILLSFLLLTFAVVSFILCRSLLNPQVFLIQHIGIQGQLVHMEKDKLRTALKPFLQTNFFTLNLDELKERVLEFPWVAEVKVTRVWPNALTIQIKEQQAVAVWNDKELLNEEGEVFVPPLNSFPANLPTLYGMPGQQRLVLDAINKINEMLKPWHLVTMRLILTPQQSWILTLTNGMQVQLGNDNIYAHFKHFLQVYNNLFLAKEDKVDYVDISYPNGMAVKWK